MRTVQMTLEEELLKAVDRLAKKLKTTRSAFTRDALRAALLKHNVAKQEQRHRAGYEKLPVEGKEFDLWEDEQSWGDL